MSRPPSAVRAAETDLSQLQQQYRSAERARRACTEKIQRVIDRDRREIQRLQDEHEGLLWSLSIFTNARQVDVNQDCAAMSALEDSLDEELEAEKGKVASLKEQILKWEKKLKEQRTGSGTTCRDTEFDNSNLLKNTCLLEDKLDRGRKYFDKLMHRNGELREELRELQLEKKEFLRVKSHLEKELCAIRKNISNLMTKYTEATNTSVEIHEKQKMLRGQNAKDVAQYINELCKLEQQIPHDSYKGAFLDIKATARNNQDNDHRKGEKCEQLESKELALEDFEDTIKQILRETEKSDVDTLIRDFKQMEEQIFTLLNFVNCQHNEAEVIRRQISQICSEREIFLAEELQKQEQHRALQMRVSIKQEATEQQLAVKQQRVEFMEKLLDKFKEGVESLLQITYESSVISGQSGSSDQVQDENIIDCLRMVEERVNKLLTLQSYLHFQEQLNQRDIDGLSTIAGQVTGITSPGASLTTAAATPAPDGEPDLVESVPLEAKEPLSREDLLTLVNKRVQRRKKTD